MSLVNKHKKLLIIVIPLIFIIGSFAFGNYVHADTGWATDIMTGLLGLFIWALGLILNLVIQGLIYIASYQEFITSPAVSYGWAMVRDVSNMFFVVILMIIAFGTILHLENYNYKKWLPKLILMAILINFSKTICGLLIDVAQVVMLTFVNAFKDVGGANITDMLGITKIVTMANNGGDSSFSTVVGAYILGLIYLLIAIVVIVTMMAMLAMRLVMIWIYVVLSPLAYLLSAFPGGQKYASQWWSEFIKNLIVGPVIAFFLWLSLASLSGANNMADIAKNKDVNSNAAADSAVIQSQSGLGTASTTNNAIGTEASTPSALIGFVVGIGMLLGGLKISQEIGGAAGSIAGKGMAKINQGAAFAGKSIRSGVSRGARNVGMAAVNQKFVRGSLDTVGAQKGAIGQVLRFTGVRGLARSGSLALGRHKLEVEEKAKKKIEAFKKVGATETLTSIASGKASTISQKAAKKEARKFVVVPEEHFDKTIGSEGLTNPTHKKEAEDRLKDLDLKKDTPSLNQIMQLGKSGINLSHTPLFRKMLEKNSEARGAYNSGQRDGGLHNYVVGTDRNGDDLTGRDRLGTLMVDRPTRDKMIGRTGETTYSLRSADKKKDNNEANNEDKSRPKTEPGQGSLSVNGFARDQQSYVGVDFAKLDPTIQAKMKANLEPGQKLSDIKGSNTFDKGEIKNIANSLIGIIDDEIKTVKSKGSSMTKGDEKRLVNLQSAKKKLKNPKELDNLELINSGASGYESAKDVKETIIHEDLHGLGVEDESDTDYLAKKAISGTPKERDEIRSGGPKFMDHLENKMDIDRGAKAPRSRKSVRDVLSSEDDDDDDSSEYNLRTGDNTGGDTINTTNITNVTNKELGEKIKNDFKNSSSSGADSSFMTYYLKRFVTSLNKLSSNIGSLNKAVPNKEPRPSIPSTPPPTPPPATPPIDLS